MVLYSAGARGLATVKGSVFNTPIGAAANFFTPALSPTNSPCTFRIHMTFDTPGIVSIQRTSAGVTVREILNQNVALVANCAYIFDILVHSLDTINIQHDAGAQILYCLVIEL